MWSFKHIYIRDDFFHPSSSLEEKILKFIPMEIPSPNLKQYPNKKFEKPRS
jgi:hypothetical protein